SRAGVLNALTRQLIVRADAVLGQRAGLPIDLDRSLALILERDDQLVLVDTAQHAEIPGPVEEHRSQVFRTGCGPIRCSRLTELTASRSATRRLGTCGRLRTSG